MNMNDRSIIEYNPPATGMKLERDNNSTHDSLNIGKSDDPVLGVWLTQW